MCYRTLYSCATAPGVYVLSHLVFMCYRTLYSCATAPCIHMLSHLVYMSPGPVAIYLCAAVICQCVCEYVYHLLCMYRVVPGHRNWQIETAAWICPRFFHCALETHWLGVRKTCGIGSLAYHIFVHTFIYASIHSCGISCIYIHTYIASDTRIHTHIGK